MTQIVEILPTPSEKLPWLTRRLVSFTSGTATLAVFTLETDYPSDAECSSDGLTVLIGKFSNDDGDGSENVTIKMNPRFFKRCRNYSNSL